jgi:MFS superfamily sulfate permease-like transporter
VLGQIGAAGGWHDVSLHADATEIPGVVVYRWEAPLFFANAGAFRAQIRTLARTRQPSWIVLQCEAITDIDVSAAAMLEQLDRELNDQGIHLAFVELRTRLQGLILRYGLFETLDRDHFYPTMRAAIAAIDAERGPNSAGE